MQKKNTFKGTVFLLITSILWGFSFVFQNQGVDFLDPFAFNGIRSLIGSVALLPVIWFISIKRTPEEKERYNTKDAKKNLLKGGTVCGIMLCIAGTLQTLGIKQGAGEAGFITTLYIVFVPIIGLFLHQKISKKIWVAVMMSLIGLYFLCGGFAFNKNQIYLILCAFFFAVHIIVIDFYAPKVDCVKLSCIQFFVTGVLDCIIMIFTDIPTWNDIALCFWPNLFYAGVISCSVAYTFQVLGQKHVSPVLGSLLMSLESVFSVVGGWLLQNDTMSLLQITGCAVIFIAIVIVQLPEGFIKDKLKA